MIRRCCGPLVLLLMVAPLAADPAEPAATRPLLVERPPASAVADPSQAPRSEAREETEAALILIFLSEFEEGDLIAWDEFVGQCNVDPECPTQLRFFSRCLGDFCEECVDSNDCLNNPTALGPTCVGGFCRCAGDPECAANPAGTVCHPVAQVCSCASEDDCSPGTGCNATPYLAGLTTCWGTGVQELFQ